LHYDSEGNKLVNTHKLNLELTPQIEKLCDALQILSKRVNQDLKLFEIEKQNVVSINLTKKQVMRLATLSNVQSLDDLIGGHFRADVCFFPKGTPYIDVNGESNEYSAHQVKIIDEEITLDPARSVALNRHKSGKVIQESIKSQLIDVTELRMNDKELELSATHNRTRSQTIAFVFGAAGAIIGVAISGFVGLIVGLMLGIGLGWMFRIVMDD